MRKITRSLGAASILGALAAAASISILPGSVHGQVTLSATGGVTLASMQVKATEALAGSGVSVAGLDVSGMRRYSAGLALAVPVATRYLFRFEGGYAQRGVKLGLPLGEVSSLGWSAERAGLGLVSLRTGHLELATLFGVRVPANEVGFYLLGGPSVAAQVQCSAAVQVVVDGIAVTVTPDCSDRDFSMLNRDFDFGAVGAAGFEAGLGAWVVSLEGRYYMGIADIADSPRDTMRHRGASVRAGIGIPIG